MVDEALRDPISVKMLKTDGGRIMKRFHVEPGPRLGWILNSLLEDVLDNAKNNNEEYLDKKTEELLTLSDTDLKALGESGKRNARRKTRKRSKRSKRDTTLVNFNLELYISREMYINAYFN